jgi:hypothetical protein
MEHNWQIGCTSCPYRADGRLKHSISKRRSSWGQVKASQSLYWTRTHTYKYIYIHNYLHAHSYTHTRTRTHSHTHSLTHSHTHIHTYTRMHTHTHIHTYTHTHIHTYTHIHTHVTHAPSCHGIECSTRSDILVVENAVRPDHGNSRRAYGSLVDSSYCPFSTVFIGFEYEEAGEKRSR